MEEKNRKSRRINWNVEQSSGHGNATDITLNNPHFMNEGLEKMIGEMRADNWDVKQEHKDESQVDFCQRWMEKYGKASREEALRIPDKETHCTRCGHEHHI